MNSIDTSGKIKFKMSVPEFLDLSLLINGQNKICIYVYAKPTNRPTSVLPSIRYSRITYRRKHRSRPISRFSININTDLVLSIYKQTQIKKLWNRHFKFNLTRSINTIHKIK